MSPTRRTLLAGLAALPAAPLRTPAGPALPIEDGTLIGMARRAGALAIMDNRAAERLADAEARTEAVAGFGVACEHLQGENGLARAERLTEWLDNRLVEAVERITDTPSQTRAGLLAKAQVWGTIRKGSWGDCSVPWVDALAASVMRDLIALHGVVT